MTLKKILLFKNDYDLISLENLTSEILNNPDIGFGPIRPNNQKTQNLDFREIDLPDLFNRIISILAHFNNISKTDKLFFSNQFNSDKKLVHLCLYFLYYWLIEYSINMRPGDIDGEFSFQWTIQDEMNEIEPNKLVVVQFNVPYDAVYNYVFNDGKWQLKTIAHILSNTMFLMCQKYQYRPHYYNYLVKNKISVPKHLESFVLVIFEYNPLVQTTFPELISILKQAKSNININKQNTKKLIK